ncbi:hypothetical protein FIBSPDRAFT_932159 [Athelia psychrophila]|uniref:DUF7918 domain-containing protein n=1 Tax=Athelia psychrophila TaxID=1759441 RepID=A0A166JCF2_9AGAM|nr:hypothetical protein FIBSPDRAFT_932159 [Fibularhizoctonia sp. CBS 109695]
MPLELNGFKAWIECDGKELEAYAVETGVNGKMISGWIASETGKRFAFKFRRATGKSEPLTACKASIYADGFSCGATMLKPLDEVNRVYRRDSLRVSEAAVLPLIFAALESTESHPVRVESQLGELAVSIWRAEVVAAESDRSWHKTPVFEPVNETKGTITHRVGFAAAVHSTATVKPGFRYKTVDKAPMAKFVFKYRSKEVLRAKGMILTPIADGQTQSKGSVDAAVENKGSSDSSSLPEEGSSDDENIVDKGPAHATAPSRVRQNRRAVVDSESEDEESSDDEDAATIAELKREAEALRAEIKTEERKKRKAEIVERKAENEDLRTQLATLRGEPAPATAPSPVRQRRSSFDDEESSGSEDAVRIAELKGEAEALRAAIKAEGKKKRKAEIVKRKAENEDLRTQLAALRGEPGTSAGPSLKKAKR